MRTARRAFTLALGSAAAPLRHGATDQSLGWPSEQVSEVMAEGGAAHAEPGLQSVAAAADPVSMATTRGGQDARRPAAGLNRPGHSESG
jgi:hypothetical protein